MLFDAVEETQGRIAESRADGGSAVRTHDLGPAPRPLPAAEEDTCYRRTPGYANSSRTPELYTMLGAEVLKPLSDLGDC